MLLHSIMSMLLFTLNIFIISRAFGDTPANCTYEDARGIWHFMVCQDDNECTHPEIRTFHLLYPNLAQDSFSNIGTWTMIYNQGFEVIVAHRKWLVMFDFTSAGKSLCDRSLPGHTHDTLLRQPKYFKAMKVTKMVSQVPRVSINSGIDLKQLDRDYQSNPDFVQQINSVQNSWIAVEYSEYSQLTLRQLYFRSGGPSSVLSRSNTFQEHKTRTSPELQEAVRNLPDEFDWRYPPNDEPSPISPVRNQEACGSCYAFASAAALEARVRLATNFTETPILSPQDIIDCSPYSEGCDGGFPYLIAGKYAEDYGIPLESCAPYTGSVRKCDTPKHCLRYYTTDYTYIGGFYGATNEALMKLELIHKGPFPVGFEVYSDFQYYRSGVYRHTGLKDTLNRFDPFELTNHAVVIVGYGTDEKSGLPYWALKNSWGTKWGEDGFFRILRGSDECGIESLGVTFDTVL